MSEPEFNVDAVAFQSNRDSEFARICYRVSIVSIIANAGLSLFKFIAGFFGHSAAMISDAVHSFSDVISTIVVIIGVKLSSKHNDPEHPYGYERTECIAAILLAALLFATAVGIFISSIKSAISVYQGNEIAIPGLLPLVAAIVSIIVKEAMYWYTIRAAKIVNSTALKADAWHHRSDALSSIGTLIGIGGARLGFPVLDPLAAIIVSVIIAKVAIEIFTDACDRMIDKSMDFDTINKIREIAGEDPDIYGIKHVRTRMFGSKFFVEIEVLANSQLTLMAAHEIDKRIGQKIKDAFPTIKNCQVKMLPATKPHRDAYERHEEKRLEYGIELEKKKKRNR